jgi:hypothetical protein
VTGGLVYTGGALSGDGGEGRRRPSRGQDLFTSHPLHFVDIHQHVLDDLAGSVSIKDERALGVLNLHCMPEINAFNFISFFVGRKVKL